MFNKVKETAKIAGWLTLGVTAIAVQKTYNTAKEIKTELDNNVPQDLVKYHYRNLCTTINNRRQTNDQSVESTA